MEALAIASTERQSAWIDRLFLRLGAMYGNLWVQRWNGFPIDAVKSDWHDELRHYDFDTIKGALDWCRGNQDLPPTLPEFSRICRQQRKRPEHQPVQNVPRLGYDNSRAREEIAKLVKNMKERKRDHLDCFREILKGEADGSYTNAYGIKMAHEALNV